MKILVSLVLLFLSMSAFSYGIGQVSYPLLINNKLISTELTGIVSSGGGVGIQGRYTQKINKKTYFDAGLGISSGSRSSRAFIGADYEILPDYNKQPKLSIKTSYENAKEIDFRKHVLSVAPILSKGFYMWGKEVYPFFSLPVALNLDYKNSTYSTAFNASAGFSSKIPIEGYQHMTGSFEATVGINDSYSAIFASVAIPLN